MTGVLKIQVVTLDDSGQKTPVTDAEVVLGRRDLLQDSHWPHTDLLPTHLHTAGGFYGSWVGEGAEPTPGEWLLVVRKPPSAKPPFSPVVQRLTLTETAGVLQALPGWGSVTDRLAAQAATVSIANAGGRDSAEAPEQTTINVLLLKATQLVAITGHDKHGTDFAVFARGRRNLLWKRGLLDDGVVSVILEQKARRISVSVKSASKSARSWITVREVALAVDENLSIEHFYEELHRVGKEQPGTLIEAGVFSHAWLMGPIIVNTSDATPSVTERSDDDTDGRQKDWLPPGERSLTPTGPVTEGPTMSKYPSIREAFHKTKGALRIWGCNHMQNVVSQCQAANAQRKQGSARDKFFFVPLQVTANGGFVGSGEQNTTLDHVKRSVGMILQSNYYGRSLEPYDLREVMNYAAAAARYLQISVFAGPPGLGSLLGRVENEPSFFIHSGNAEKPGRTEDTVSDPPAVYRREASHPGTESNPVFQWFKAEYPSIALDELRYTNYTAMLAEPLPDPGFHTERFAMFYDDGQLDQDVDGTRAVLVLRLATGLEVQGAVNELQQPSTVYSRPAPHVIDGVPGHRYLIRRRKIDRVERRGPATVVVLTAPPPKDPNKKDAKPAEDPGAAFDSAIFVGADGRSIWFESPTGKNEFVRHTSPIPVGHTEFFWKATWMPFTRSGTISDGVVETAEVRCYW